MDVNDMLVKPDGLFYSTSRALHLYLPRCKVTSPYKMRPRKRGVYPLTWGKHLGTEMRYYTFSTV